MSYFRTFNRPGFCSREQLFCRFSLSISWVVPLLWCAGFSRVAEFQHKEIFDSTQSENNAYLILEWEIARFAKGGGTHCWNASSNWITEVHGQKDRSYNGWNQGQPNESSCLLERKLVLQQSEALTTMWTRISWRDSCQECGRSSCFNWTGEGSS